MVDAACAPSPDDLVDAAELIAARLRSGGRLLVDGRRRAAIDARHVVVEFMHPVTVGKRAFPAMVGTASAGPDDIALSIAYAGSAVTEPVDVALSDVAPTDGTRWVRLPSEPGAAKVAAVLSYHVLWELVQLEMERTPEHPGESAASTLYPMIYSGGEDRTDERRAAATDSARAKIAESAVVCAHALEDNAAGIDRAVRLIGDARAVYTFGNGGSSTDAADAAIAIGDRAHSLVDDVATITALANDVAFDVVFARQLATLGRAGDCAIGFSTSGNSPNVVEAARTARSAGMTTIGLAGYDGGAMVESGVFDAMIVVDSDSVHRIQEAQSAVLAEIVRRLR